jgi:hypothetical protein
VTTGLWSAVLAGFGLVGLWLAGRKDWRGWALGLVDEALWIIYAVQTRQWAFGVSALAYGWVYWRNLRTWRGAGSGRFLGRSWSPAGQPLDQSRAVAALRWPGV